MADEGLRKQHSSFIAMMKDRLTQKESDAPLTPQKQEVDVKLVEDITTMIRDRIQRKG